MSINAEMLHDCLTRLVPHVDTTRIGLTGGVAIDIHLHAARVDRMRAVTTDDVDFVTADVGAVWETVTSEFLVSHFHWHTLAIQSSWSSWSTPSHVYDWTSSPMHWER